MAVKPIPDGYHTLTPYLFINGAAKALEYYTQAFGAVESMRVPGPPGKLMHAEMRVGDSAIMLADEFPDMGFRGPQTLGGSTVSILLYVEDVDTVFQRALELGGTQLKPLRDEFYGDRTGTLVDPFGHIWTVATHKEDVAPEEMEKRMQAMMQQQGQC
jgi:PhnB protein